MVLIRLGTRRIWKSGQTISVDNAKTLPSATPIEIANCLKAKRSVGLCAVVVGGGKFQAVDVMGAGPWAFSEMRTNVGTVIKPKDEQ